MTTVVLFHSALGLGPGVHRFAEDLRERGHQIHTPDLYGGRTAEDVAIGIALRGEVGIHGALVPHDLGLTGWPRIPLQLHLSADDPWVDAASVDGLLAAVGDDAEVHRYPGTAHLFTDPDLPDHDPSSRAAVVTRVGAALARWDAG